MVKVITGLDRVQTSRLVELVLGDSEIALAPRVLSPLAAVRATLMYLRTNASQEAIADIMVMFQPTISRTISVITRIIARALGPCWRPRRRFPTPACTSSMGPSCRAGAGRTGPTCGRAVTSAPV